MGKGSSVAGFQTDNDTTMGCFAFTYVGAVYGQQALKFKRVSHIFNILRFLRIGIHSGG